MLQGVATVVEDGMGVDQLGNLCEREFLLTRQQDEVFHAFADIVVLLFMRSIVSRACSRCQILVQVLAHDSPRKHLIRFILVEFNPWFLCSCLGILLASARLRALVLDVLYKVVHARRSPVIEVQHLVYGLSALQMSLTMLGDREEELVHEILFLAGPYMTFVFQNVMIPHGDQHVDDVE